MSCSDSDAPSEPIESLAPNRSACTLTARIAHARPRTADNANLVVTLHPNKRESASLYSVYRENAPLPCEHPPDALSDPARQRRNGRAHLAPRPLLFPIMPRSLITKRPLVVPCVHDPRRTFGPGAEGGTGSRARTDARLHHAPSVKAGEHGIPPDCNHERADQRIIQLAPMPGLTTLWLPRHAASSRHASDAIRS